MESVPVLSISKLESNMCNELKTCFETSFGNQPSFFVRIPGRVNLIGEHIDYCGFAVLPMAIEHDIVIAARVNSTNTINLVNFNSQKYKKFSTLVEDLNINTACPEWYHYFFCGYLGIKETHKLANKGFDVLVKGTIPPSSGLSSSSALVCASALVVTHANRIILSKTELASLCAISERYIGTQGGGMDQAIQFLAKAGTAKLIEFDPLRVLDVLLPENVVFVVGNSCVSMNKAATSQYNMRVVECRLAAKVLAKKLGFDWHKVQKLHEIPALLGKDLSEMKAVVISNLQPKVYDRSDLCSLLDVQEDVFSTFLTENTANMQKFQLFQRARHVFEEAYRVRKFQEVCKEERFNVERLGQLMNESHQSCRDLYECSHPILEKLVKTALDSGAIGCRLTGAGWGGCCVSLVMKSHVKEFLRSMTDNFYGEIAKENENFDIDSVLFVTEPGGGAAVYSL